MFAEPIESVTRLVTLSKGLIGQGQASTAHVLELSELTEELFPQMQPGPLLQCGSYHKEGAVCTGKGNGISGHSMSPGDTAQSHRSKWTEQQCDRSRDPALEAL